MNIYEKIEEHINENNKVIIAIDGPSGSGKSTLGKTLQSKYDCLLFHMDDYFLPETMKTSERLSKPGGNVHLERLEDELFSRLKDTYLIQNKFDCKIQQLGMPKKIPNKDIIIVEGVYSLHPVFQSKYTLKILLQVSEEEQIKRIRERNGDKMLSRWITEWIPLENKYFKAFSIEKIADFTINL